MDGWLGGESWSTERYCLRRPFDAAIPWSRHFATSWIRLVMPDEAPSIANVVAVLE